MAEPMLYDLTVRGVSEEETQRVGEELAGLNIAPEEGERGGYPLSRCSRYFCTERAANFWGSEDTKWSSDEEDLRQLSERFPGKLFELNVSGYPDDECVIYARDGRTCVIEPYRVWPEFNESMLKPTS